MNSHLCVLFFLALMSVSLAQANPTGTVMTPCLACSQVVVDILNGNDPISNCKQVWAPEMCQIFDKKLPYIFESIRGKTKINVVQLCEQAVGVCQTSNVVADGCWKWDANINCSYNSNGTWQCMGGMTWHYDC